MIDDPEIPAEIRIAIEVGKEKIKKIEYDELMLKKAARDMTEYQNKKYRELIAEQIPSLLQPYALLDRIAWPFTSEPESIQPSQSVHIKINGLPEFIMEWMPYKKRWIAFLPEKTSKSYEINYYDKFEVDDVEILLAELHNTLDWEH